MLSLQEQKKKDFFKIRKRLKEIAEHIDLADAQNRFSDVDAWMSDLLLLARKYGEGNLEKTITEYNKHHSHRALILACMFLSDLFFIEKWRLGILKKYIDYALCETSAERIKKEESINYLRKKAKVEKMDTRSLLKEMKKAGLIDYVIL